MAQKSLENIDGPEIDSHKYSQLISTNIQRQFNRESIVFSINGVEIIRCLYAEK